MVNSNVNSARENEFKTLIVEDNHSFRQILRDSLETLFPSMVIQEEEDGRAVLRKVNAFIPHLIFMDVQLPGENGLNLTRQIRASHPDINIVIMTSYNTPEYREAAEKCGANCFIEKDGLSWGRIETLVHSFLPGFNMEKRSPTI